MADKLDYLKHAQKRCSDRAWADRVMKSFTDVANANDRLILRAFEVDAYVFDGDLKKCFADFKEAAASLIAEIEKRPKSISFAERPVTVIDEISEMIRSGNYHSAAGVFCGSAEELDTDTLQALVDRLADEPFQRGNVEDGKYLFGTLVDELCKRTTSKEGFCSKALANAISTRDWGEGAVDFVNRPAAMILIEKGADLRSVENCYVCGWPEGKGNTLLHYLLSARKADRALVKAIVKAGHPVTVKNKAGDTMINLLGKAAREEWGQALFDKYAPRDTAIKDMKGAAKASKKLARSK